MGVPIPQPAPASFDRTSGAQVIDGSLRFNGTNQYLSRNFGTGGDRRRWTWSAWVKRHKFGASNYGLFSYDPGGNGSFIRFSDDGGGDTLRWYSDYNSRSLVTEGQFRDPSSWYHVVIALDTSNGSGTPGGAASLNERDRVKRYINGVEQVNNASNTFPAKNENQNLNQSGNHSIGRIQGSTYGPVSMSNVYFVDGRQLEPEEFGFTDPLTGIWRPKKFNIRDENNPNDGSTWSNGVTLGQGSFLEPASKAFDGNLLTSAAPYDTAGGGGTNPSITCSFTSFGGIPFKRSVRVYRSNGQANNHTISFNGGTPVNHPWYEWFTVATGPGTLNSIQSVNNNNTNTTGIAAIEVDGYVLLDGQVNNSFYLPMDNQDDFEKDKSGNGNDWTKNNFSGTETDPDVLKDSPSGAAFGGAPTSGVTTTSSAPSNYCTLNPFDNIGATLSNGNLTITDTSVYYRTIFGTQTSVDGKQYFEVDVTTLGTTMGVGVYVGNNRSGIDANNYAYDANTYIVMYNGSIYHDGSTYSYQSAYGAGDTVGVAIDSKNKKVWLSKNGAYPSGDNPETGAGGMQSVSGVGDMPDGEIYPMVMVRNATVTANFGQKPLKYAPPKGFKSLSSAGTKPATVISDPTQYVGVTTYRGNGSSGRAFDLGMSPDFVWVKRRDGTYDNMLFDTVRGDGKEIYSERNYAQGSPATSKLDFIVNGFDLPSTGVNVNGNSYVAWFWKAGGNKNTFNVDDVGYSSASDAGLDGGDLTPSAASVGTKQGFSIIKWTGVDNATPKTISHGLTNQTPRFVIVKNLTDAENWAVYHASIGPTKYVRLNGNSSYDTSSAYWNNTAPTTTLITLNNSAEVQRVNREYVLYAWADVPGLQKFGSYKCNGDGSGGGAEDGPYVELGFRPALVLFRGDYTSDWAWIDEERCKVNYNDVALRANYQYSEIGNARGGVGSSSQPANYAVDFLSNGFKIRASGGSLNSGTNTVTYAAWAKSPFSDLYGGGANAR